MQSEKALMSAPVHGVLLPCPFCGATGRCGPDGAYYFEHAKGCWIRSQRGTMLDCVSWEELEQWNARSDREDAEKWRSMQRSFSRPDQMRPDIAPVWDSRNVGQ
jgi:hypothetical protein